MYLTTNKYLLYNKVYGSS